MWHGVPFARQRRPIIGILRMCWLLPGSFDCLTPPPCCIQPKWGQPIQVCPYVHRACTNTGPECPLPLCKHTAQELHEALSHVEWARCCTQWPTSPQPGLRPRSVWVVGAQPCGHVSANVNKCHAHSHRRRDGRGNIKCGRKPQQNSGVHRNLQVISRSTSHQQYPAPLSPCNKPTQTCQPMQTGAGHGSALPFGGGGVVLRLIHPPNHIRKIVLGKKKGGAEIGGQF